MKLSRPLVFTLVLASVILIVVRAEEPNGCAFFSHSYKPGDVWHPKLESSRSNYCVTCRCILNDSQKPELNCSSVLCPMACTGEEIYGCCPVCSDMKLIPEDPDSALTTFHQRDAASSSFGVPAISGGFTSQITRNGIENNFSQRCIIGSVSYAHGENIPGNNTDLKKDRCNHCTCNNGRAQCKIKACPAITCVKPMITSKNCCPRCPGDFDADTNNWDTVVSFSNGATSGKNSPSKDCKSGDRYFNNGATWHPIIGPFGEMDCVLCKCNAGRIDCARLKCQSKRDLPCDKPIKITGHCCPVCENQQKFDAGVYSDVMSPETHSEDGPFKRCISTRSDFTVWKSSGGGISTQVLQYLFTPLGSNSKLDIHHHRFMLRNKHIEDITAQSISFDDYSRLKSNFHFTLIGGTTRRLVTKLEKREGKLMRKCTKYNTSLPPQAFAQGQSPCGANVSRFEGILKLKKIQMKQWCGAGEKEI